MGEQPSAASDQRRDTIGRILRAVTGSSTCSQDVVVISEAIADVLGWVAAGAHVLWLTRKSERLAPHDRVFVRPLDEHRDLIPPNMFPFAWIRCGTDGASGDEFPTALRSLRPGGTAATVHDLASAASGHVVDMVNVTSVGGVELSEQVWLYTKREDVRADGEPECYFCLPNLHALNGEIGLPGATSIIWGDEDFSVMPDLAPIVSGHLLVVPTQHHLSMASSSAHLLQQLEKHANRVASALRAAYDRETVFLEHGAMFPHDAGSCIDHAHWHCFPMPNTGYSVIESLKNSGYGGFSIDLDHLLAARAERKSYLLVRERGKTYFFPVDDAQCQFLRFHIAEATEGGQWLWHHMYATKRSREIFRETLSRLVKVAHLT